MARSHHRKKHKSHLKQFKQSHDNSVTTSGKKGKVTATFTLLGAATGFGIAYFATAGNMTGIIIGLIVGAVTGYFIGHRIDQGRI
jgi:ABC-type dipeptide/oligopeptide/nickel transport system permease subunit